MTPLLAQRPSPDRAFERMYQRYVGDVYRYVLVVLRNPADAEDVTQTTFMNAYRAFQRGERPRAPQNWLISIAHNVCRQRFRQSARRPEEVAFDEEVGNGIPEDDHGPSAEDIQRALGHLAFNQRAALVMRELEGRSYTEIAEILGLSVSAVETLLFRARRALREQLEGSLTCGEAELSISKQMDGRLSRLERGALRAHLRECAECARFARSQRAHRAAFKTLAALPLPGSLGSFFGAGGAAVGTGVAAKAAALLAAGVVVAGAGYEASQHGPLGRESRNASAAVDAAGGLAPLGLEPFSADFVAASPQRVERRGASGNERADTAKAKKANGGLAKQRARTRGKVNAKGHSKASASGRGHRVAPKKTKTHDANRRTRSRGQANGHGAAAAQAAPAQKPPARPVKPPALPKVKAPKVPEPPPLPTPELPPIKKPK